MPAMRPLSAGSSAPSKHRRFGYALHVLRRSPLSIVGVTLVGIVLCSAAFAPLIAPYGPYQVNIQERLQPPSLKHIAGTDDLGRDIFSRIVYGSRISLLVAASVVAISGTIGILVGSVTGYFGGIPDMILMRITDGFLAIPSFILAMVAVAALGPSLLNTILALGVVWWTWYARIIRGAVLKLKTSDFILIERAMGARRARILFRHIIPNCMGPIVVQSSLQAGLAILTSAGLSFLGLGAQAPLPEWGLMVAAGRAHVPARWWFVTFPGLAILLLVAGFILLGDGIRDVFEREVS